tara:strand:+ start:514 stop:1098 length:585 start_codon:yes stop_codon:yes gene_type:complete
MRITFATKNKGKIKELRDLAENTNLIIDSVPDEVVFPKESGVTYQENALIKARHIFDLVGTGVIADDSGLEVDSLNGDPGILSSRYSKEATDAANINKLLMNLEKSNNRKARFRCSMACILDKNSEPLFSDGILEGLITTEQKGKNGFGYDPVFFLPKLGFCMAEISNKEKSMISHRAIAFRKMIKKIGQIKPN